MCVIIGTAYFAWYDPSEAAAFSEGRRIVGKPPLNPGEKLLMDKNTGQYKIEVSDPVKKTEQQANGAVMKLSNSMLNLLAECRIEGAKLFLPDRQLDRAVYTQINKVLELLGGKWNRSAKAHIFEHDIEDHIAQCIVAGEVVDKKKEYQFFPTPAVIAERMVKEADIKPGDVILEPSAGKGAIVDAIPACHKDNILCVEMNPECAEVLKEKGYRVITHNYLDLEATGDINKIVMNPPFTKQQDIRHVMKAFGDLATGGRLVAVVSESCFFRENKLAENFREFLNVNGADVIDLEPGAFQSSGTMVKTRIIVINKGGINA